MASETIKAQFKVPEGRHVLHSAKQSGLVPFALRRTTRLTIATLHGGDEEGMYMVYNVGDYLHVSPFDATEKVSLCLQQQKQFAVAIATAPRTMHQAVCCCCCC